MDADVLILSADVTAMCTLLLSNTHRLPAGLLDSAKEGDVAVGHGGLTPRLRLSPPVLGSYPCPLVRWTSKLRLLSPEPSRVRLVNPEDGCPTETAQRPPASKDG